MDLLVKIPKSLVPLLRYIVNLAPNSLKLESQESFLQLGPQCVAA